MTLSGEYQARLTKIMDDYRKSRPGSLQSVLEEVCEAIRYGEIIDAYQARYLRDALYSSEELKANNKDIVELIESKFFN
jgi:hypothetical protein